MPETRHVGREVHPARNAEIRKLRSQGYAPAEIQRRLNLSRAVVGSVLARVVMARKKAVREAEKARDLAAAQADRDALSSALLEAVAREFGVTPEQMRAANHKRGAQARVEAMRRLWAQKGPGGVRLFTRPEIAALLGVSRQAVHNHTRDD